MRPPSGPRGVATLPMQLDSPPTFRPPPRLARAPATAGLLCAFLLTAPAAAFAVQDPPAPREPVAAATAERSGGEGESAAADRIAAGASRLLNEAEELLAAGRTTEAVEAFERAAAELGKVALYGGPDRDAWGEESLRAARGLAHAYLEAGESYLARIEVLRALNIDPAEASLHVLLGESYYSEGRFPEAEAAFAEALRLDPALGAAHAGKALLELSANHLASARQSFSQAYRLERDPESLWFLARIAFIERDYGAAAKHLREYLEREPNLSEERRDEVRERARVYARLKDGKGSRFATRVTRGQLRFDVARGDEVPLVPVRVNGRDPVYVVFDTGAQDHVLDREFARELGLELSGPAGRVENSFGSVERRLAVVDSLNLEGIVVESVPFSVADLGELGFEGRRSYYVAGVLNPALLLRDFLIRVDFRHRTIELMGYETGGQEYLERRPTLRRLSVPFRFNADGTGMIVQGELGASPAHPLLLDTGASDIYLSASTGRILDLDPLDVRVGLGEYEKTKLRAHFLRDLGRVEEDGLPARGVAYEGILGYPFFRDMRLVFDYYHGLLLIES
jgi:tetratricopeptide (TPR) repeat protein